MTGVAMVEKLPIEKNVYEKEFSEKIGRAGPIDFICIVANDCYKGLDQVVQCTVDVVEADPLRQEYSYEQEDLDLVKDAKKEQEVEETADDSDQAAPEAEDDKDELVRRLKRHDLAAAATHFEERVEQRKQDAKGKTLE